MRPIDADALIEKIRFREGPAMGQREIFLVEGEPTLFLNTLRDAIYEDAVAHGLWDLPEELLVHTGLNTEEKYLVYSALLISDEVQELIETMDKVDEHMEEELADVIIMTLSVAGKLGLDIDKAVKRKMEINKTRPWRHENEGGN